MEVYQSSRTAAELDYALGAIPSIGANNHWFIGDQDTGIIAKGQTPFVGDNGNWWVGETDTGAFAGGVDVTGAEVGQTIQVTAVDENGRPTAWEAVKFPRGDNWELIVHNVVEERSGLLYHNVDDNGTPFELAKATVILNHLPGLKDDGSYARRGASISFLNVENVNAVAAAEGISSTGISLTWSLPHTNVILSCTQPDGAENGRAFSILQAENVNGTMVITNFQSSQSGVNTNDGMQIMQKFGCYAAARAAGQGHGTITVDALANDRVFAEINKLSALVIGDLDNSIGVGSEYWLYGVRK